MAKTIIIGTLTEIDEIQAKENYSSQQFRICVQEFDQDTGEKKEPQVFPVTIFNKKIKELGPDQYKDKKVKCTCYLKSVAKEKDGKVFYNILLNGNTLEPA